MQCHPDPFSMGIPYQKGLNLPLNNLSKATFSQSSLCSCFYDNQAKSNVTMVAQHSRKYNVKEIHLLHLEMLS